MHALSRPLTCALSLFIGFLAASPVHGMTVPGRASMDGECGGAGETIEMYDAGTANNAYGANPDHTDSVRVVQRLNPGGRAVIYTTVCLAFTTDLGETAMIFEIVAYDGSDGSPGAEIAAIPALVSDIPDFPGFAWYEFDLSGVEIIHDAPLYIGARWIPVDPPQLLAVDEDPATPRNPGFFKADSGGGWRPLENLGAFQDYRALLVRAAGEGVEAPGPLFHDRFEANEP